MIIIHKLIMQRGRGAQGVSGLFANKNHVWSCAYVLRVVRVHYTILYIILYNGYESYV